MIAFLKLLIIFYSFFLVQPQIWLKNFAFRTNISLFFKFFSSKLKTRPLRFKRQLQLTSLTYCQRNFFWYTIQKPVFGWVFHCHFSCKFVQTRNGYFQVSVLAIFQDIVGSVKAWQIVKRLIVKLYLEFLCFFCSKM